MNDQPNKLVDVPAIRISFQLPLDDGSGRQLIFESYTPADCPDDVLNDLLDKLSRAGERQKSLVLLPTYKNQLEEARAALVAETNALFLATSERDAQSDLWRRMSTESNKRNWRPAPGQMQERQKIEARIEQHTKNINVLEKKIASEEGRISIYENRLNAGA